MSGHVRLANDFIKHSELSPVQFKLYTLLLAYQGANESAWPSQDRLCAEVPCSKDTLILAIERLVESGLIEVQKRYGRGRANEYKVATFCNLEKVQSDTLLGSVKGPIGHPFKAAKRSNSGQNKRSNRTPRRNDISSEEDSLRKNNARVERCERCGAPRKHFTLVDRDGQTICLRCADEKHQPRNTQNTRSKK